MIDRLIDDIERSIHFLFLFWKNNPIYLLCSLFYYVISSLLLGGTAKSFLIVFVVYAVSLIIGFSPLGEKFLRLLNRVRPLETKRETEYLQPLFDEVYERAKEKYKKLRKIEICVIDNMTVNAMAIGRRTIAVTKGAMQTFTEDELKAVIGHELAHLIHGDTMATLYIIIGNGILSVFLLIARLFILLLDWIQNAFNGKRSIFSALMLLIRLYFEFSIRFLNFGLQVILAINSRKNEFKADMFSYAMGYDSDMIEALYLLEKISLGDNSTIIQKMIASHPRITLRIKHLEEFDDVVTK
jgi:heat shock protein HtpX